jgi:hypothetical protein
MIANLEASQIIQHVQPAGTCLSGRRVGPEQHALHPLHQGTAAIKIAWHKRNYCCAKLAIDGAADPSKGISHRGYHGHQNKNSVGNNRCTHLNALPEIFCVAISLPDKLPQFKKISLCVLL